MRISKAQYELWLNRFYAEVPPDVTFNEFKYLANKGREKHCTMYGLRSCIANNVVGRMIRRYDPLKFESDYYFWREEAIFWGGS